MSHFAVLVIGDDVDHELAPFHEFEYTGVNNEFVAEIDETDDAHQIYKVRMDDPDYPDFKSFVESWYGYKAVPFGDEPDLEDEHKYGYFLTDEKGEVTKVIDRTNKNSKWDYYIVGGRWTGALLTKNGQDVDSAKKGEIDFERMRKDADDEVRKTYRESGYNPSMSWRSWKEIFEDQAIPNDKRQGAYWNQPNLILVRENRKKAAEAAGDRWFDFRFNYDDFLGLTEDEYVEQFSTRGLNFYAMVKERQWASRGEMGWFGMSDDDLTNQEWRDLIQEQIDLLPDDAILTVVDCHI